MADIPPITLGMSEAATRDIVNATIAATNDLGDNPSTRVPLLPPSRPGDGAPWFTGSAPLLTDPTTYPDLPSGVAIGVEGQVYRFVGEGYCITKRLFPIESDKLYAVRCSFARSQDPRDPAGDAVRFGVMIYAADMSLIADLALQTFPSVTVASGRQTAQAIITRLAPQPGLTVLPAAARYARPYVEAFGGNQGTDVDTIDLYPVLQAGTIDPTAAGAANAAAAAVSAGQALASANAAAASAATQPGTGTSNADGQVQIGQGALVSPTPGMAKDSIAIGPGALAACKTFDSSVAIGYNAFTNLADGRSGVAVGHRAGESWGGSSNTFIGAFCGVGIPSSPGTGVDNCGLGEACLFAMQGAASFNNAFGFNTLFGLTSGSRNSVFGNAAGLFITSGGGNSAFGCAAYQYGSGSNNCVFGYTSVVGRIFLLNTSAASPSGSNVLYFSDTSSLAVGMEVYIGSAIAPGAFISAVYSDHIQYSGNVSFNAVTAGLAVTIVPNPHTGTGVSAFGFLAGNQIEGATSDVTLIGRESGRYLSTASFATAVGAYSFQGLLNNHLASIGPTGLGHSAGRYLLGDRNVAIGRSALQGSAVTPSTGSDNTAIGDSVAINLTTGSRNLFLGSGTAPAVTTGNDNILLGPGLALPSPTTSGFLGIGNASGIVFGATGLTSGGTIKPFIRSVPVVSGVSTEKALYIDTATNELRRAA